MKVRNGFVSNSSSSSFVLGKNFLTKEQIDKLSECIEEINTDSNEGYINISDKYFHGKVSYDDTDKLIDKLNELKIDKNVYDFGD